MVAESLLDSEREVVVSAWLDPLLERLLPFPCFLYDLLDVRVALDA